MNSCTTTLETQHGAQGRLWRLCHHTAGTESAGAGTREVAEYWSVTCIVDGAVHGQRFSDPVEAADYYSDRTLKRDYPCRQCGKALHQFRSDDRFCDKYCAAQYYGYSPTPA